jgi:hypothetical protein
VFLWKGAKLKPGENQVQAKPGIMVNRWSCKNLRAPARMQLNQQFGLL